MKKEYKTLSFRLIQLRSRENVMLTLSNGTPEGDDEENQFSNHRSTSSMIWGEDE